ncbi:MAG: iron-sulfur cluster carrier protein ApbC [Proteobacteria bacterium]|nr:iron-sulfur cluster carrier protein ApbC [Pseudomonadota bacterium]
MIQQELLSKALQKHKLPIVDQDVVSRQWLDKIRIDKNHISVDLKLGFPIQVSIQELFQDSIKQCLASLAPPEKIQVNISYQVRAHAIQSGVAAIPAVKNLIAVASGKGGVGKSTTAINVAVALHQQGARVGILDADIYGPNQPHLLGVKSRPRITEDKKIEPIIAHGLQSMSIGYLVDESTPMVWRGPMISAALQQLVRDTLWDNLDYLVVDLPPGTGDIQLTLAKNIPVTGVVMVTTPQDVALLDVRKSLEMFKKVNVDVLGVIENMSSHVCSQCGHEELLFGSGGAARLAERYQLKLFGQVPLSIAIRQDCDNGKPTSLVNSESHLAGIYREMSLKIAAELSYKKINYGSKIPKVVIE